MLISGHGSHGACNPAIVSFTVSLSLSLSQHIALFGAWEIGTHTGDRAKDDVSASPLLQ